MFLRKCSILLTELTEVELSLVVCMYLCTDVSVHTLLIYRRQICKMEVMVLINVSRKLLKTVNPECFNYFLKNS